MKSAIENLRHDRDALLAELERAGAVVIKPGSIRCPFHEDAHPSAGVYQADDGGAWKFKCHGCGFHGDVFDVMARVQGNPVADVLRAERQRQGNRQPTPLRRRTKPAKRVYPSIAAIQQVIPDIRHVYQYTNPDNREVELVVFRCEQADGSKRFIQARPEGGGVVLEAPSKPWPLYNRTRVRNAGQVVFVEGEKCVHVLAELGIVATTSPCGAGKAVHCDLTPLSGKRVILWPDADLPDDHGERKGIAHMRDVARLLDQLDPPAQTRWIDADRLGLPTKGDVVDYLAQHPDCDAAAKRYAVEAVLLDAEPMGDSGEVGQLLEDVISGKSQPVPWPWPLVGNLTQALLPGTVTLICGDAGSAKSFLLLEAVAHWYERGVKTAVFMLEEDRAYHLHRALAQRSGQSLLLNRAWVADHPDEVRRLFHEHQDFLDGLGRCIHDAPDEPSSLMDLAAWVERMAMAGNRVIAIDPVSLATVSDKRYLDDHRFVVQVKKIMRQFETSLVLITHPAKGHKKGVGMDDLAGGAAYARFTQDVLWLKRHHPPEESTVAVHTPMGTVKELVTHNCALRICKTRNGVGRWMEIAYEFDDTKVRFVERGVILE